MKLPKHLKIRSRRLNRRRFHHDGVYVLCWLQQALRAEDNPVIDTAISLGNEFGVPVVVYHGIDNRYPHASHRFHRFLLESSQSLEAGCQKRRLRFCRHIVRESRPEPGLVYRIAEEAVCLVTDDMPTYYACENATKVAGRLMRPVFVVDAACAVPMNALSDKLDATKAFRAAHRPLRDQWITVNDEVVPSVRKYTRKLCFEHDSIDGFSGAKLDQLIRTCGVDMSLPHAPDFPGSRAAGLKKLEHALEHIIPRYKWTRNNPALADSTTKLSPYLRFGVLGPREVAAAVNAAELHSAARWKFLDELLTWREYYYHLARHSKSPTAYSNLPAWARKTLGEHLSDKRPNLYTLSQLAHGETGDETWNAAQKQFLIDGWMHNNLRMYWVKQILQWCPTPEDAWKTACYLNDRLSLDGREPATYGSIQWGFGRSRRAYRELPVYGWVPTKNDTALRKRDGVPDWLRQQAGRESSRLCM